MIATIYIAGLAVYLALLAWVYFDAMERDKPAFAWAGSLVVLNFFGFIPLVLYLIFRETGVRPQVPPGGARRQVAYIVSITGLTTMLIGLTLLITMTLLRVISEEDISDDDYRQTLAASLAAIIIGTGFWAAFWFRAAKRVYTMPDDVEFRATFNLHRAYLYTVFAIAWIVIFIAGLWVLGGGLAQALDAEDVEPEFWVPVLGPVVVALLTIAFHYLIYMETADYNEMVERYESIPPPPMIGGSTSTAPAMIAAIPTPATPPPAAGQARFCSSCGAVVTEGGSFCTACGASLSR